VFEGGFVQQHHIEVTDGDGFVGRIGVCFVADGRDGRISRADGSFDTGQVDAFLPPSEPAAPST
jgi:hypothetical protein